MMMENFDQRSLFELAKRQIHAARAALESASLFIEAALEAGGDSGEIDEGPSRPPAFMQKALARRKANGSARERDEGGSPTT